MAMATKKQDRRAYHYPVACFLIGLALMWGCLDFSHGRTRSRSKAPRKTAAQYVHEGKQLLLKGRYSAAIRRFTSAIKRDSRYADAYKFRGWSYDRIGAPIRAKRDLARYIELRPSDPKGYLIRADYHNFENNYKAALEDYDKALSLAGDWLNARIGRGLALVGLGRYSEAIREYEWVLKKKPNNAEVLANLGVAAMRSGRPLTAIKSFEKALKYEKDPKWKRHMEKWIAMLEKDPEIVKRQPFGLLLPIRKGRSTPLW
jgi:tetratricopeptide (TPR) repeat protein